MSETKRAARPMPPVHIQPRFLDTETHEKLLAFALARQGSFVASETFTGHQPAARRSKTLLDSAEPWHRPIVDRARELLPAFCQAMGMKPFKARYEMQMVAHNDGDYYRSHIDTRTGGAEHHVRVLTGVYYFYKEPRAFSGGALRLHRLGGDGSAREDYLEVHPEQNNFVVFPSWAQHEVRPVRCPTGAFQGSRFSVNCWMLALIGWTAAPATIG